MPALFLFLLPILRTRAAPAEREAKGVRNLQRDFPRTKPAGKCTSNAGEWREPVEDSRFQSAHIRKTPVLSELARMCKFAPSVFSFGPSTARFLFGKTKRKWGVDCQAINIAYLHPIGRPPASHGGQKNQFSTYETENFTDPNPGVIQKRSEPIWRLESIIPPRSGG